MEHRIKMCVVAIDNEYEAVPTMAQEYRYALYMVILKCLEHFCSMIYKCVYSLVNDESMRHA